MNMTCDHCGSKNLSKITLELGDGTQVCLNTCHFCEFRTWASEEGRLPLAKVVQLAAANRPR